MSSSTLITALNAELHTMDMKGVAHSNVFDQKIKQLSRLSYAMIFCYGSMACMVAASLLGALLPQAETLVNYVMILGVILVFCALVMLTYFALKASSLRIRQFEQEG